MSQEEIYPFMEIIDYSQLIQKILTQYSFTGSSKNPLTML